MKNPSQGLSSEKGLSLIEMVVVIGLMGIFVAGLMTAMNDLNKQTLNSRESMETEGERFAAEVAIRQVIDQAVDVHFENLPTLNLFNSTGNLAGSGAIVRYESNNFFGVAANPIQAIAAFYRDARVSQIPSPTIASPLLRTGVFFQNPTPRKSGALYITLNGLVPGRDQLFFENLVRVRTENIITFDIGGAASPNPGSPVTSFDLLLTFRKFYGNTSAPRNFCPATAISAAVAGCTGMQGFKDTERTMRLVLRNNVLARSLTSPPPATNTDVQPRWTRVYDSIYFMQPQFQGGFQ